MSSENRLRLFDEWADDYDHSVHSMKDFPFDGYEHLLDRVVVLSKPVAGMKVLDLGTGTGNLAQKFDLEGVSIWGLDFSVEMLDKARIKVPRANFGQADLTGAWPAEFEQKYERIVSAYVFHEFTLTGKISLLQRLAANNLAADGLIVIGDISFQSAESLNKMKELAGDGWDGNEYYWKAQEIIPELENVVFDIRYEQVSSCAGIYTFRPAIGKV